MTNYTECSININMYVLTHTLIAVGCIAAAFSAGRYFTIFTLSEKMVSTVLDTLERDGFIKTVTDSDGEVEIVSIADIIREDRIANSN